MRQTRKKPPDDPVPVKTARFANIVKICGNPSPYLAFADPNKDPVFQKAVKTNRVMTVFQEATGHKTDHGEIGFLAGRSRQFLVFPRSLRAFAGRTIIGIKYELWNTPEKEGVASPASQSKEVKKRPEGELPSTRVSKKRRRPVSPKGKEAPSPAKIIPFQPKESEPDEDEEVAHLKSEIKRAMALLEAGKAVAAFNLLNRVVG